MTTDSPRDVDVDVDADADADADTDTDTDTTDPQADFSLDPENIAWVERECGLSADRARDHGVSPMEFLAGVVSFTQAFVSEYTAADYTHADVVDAFTTAVDAADD